MNIKAIFAASACALTLMACGGPGEGKSLSEIKNATETDSLFYYFGQIRANDYWQQAHMDSTFKSEEARSAYLKGLQEGINLGKEGEVAYNRGLLEGLNLSMNCEEFQKEYKQKPNKNIVVESIAYGLRNDSIVNASEAQAAFYQIMGRLNEQKLELDKAASQQSLKKTAASKKMEAVNDDLYEKVIKAGNGEMVKRNDKLNLSVEFKKLNGSDLGFPAPEELEVNSSLPEPLINALLKMKVGEKAEFASTALAFFGQRCAQRGLEPADVILFTIDIKGISAAAEANPETVSVKPIPSSRPE